MQRSEMLYVPFSIYFSMREGLITPPNAVVAL